MLNIKILALSCDGTTDDSAAFTLATTKPTGTTVYIPQNVTCLVTSQEFRFQNKIVKLVGADRATSIIKLKAGTTITTNLFWWNNPPTGSDGPTVQDLTVDMNDLDVGGAFVTSVFSFTSADLASVRRVSILNMGNVVTAPAGTYVIGCSGCTNVTVEDNYFKKTTPDQNHQSKAMVNFNTGGPSIGGSIRRNVLINTNFGFGCVQRYVLDSNDVSGWGVGAGIALGWGTFSGADCNSWNNIVSNNWLHDSQWGADMYGISPNGLEIWSDKTVISNNIAWNNSNSGVSWGGNNVVVSGNLAYDNSRLTPGGSGFLAAYADVNHNAVNTIVVGNRAYDTGAGTQTYGYSDMSQTLGIQLLDNSFTGTVPRHQHIGCRTDDDPAWSADQYP